MTEDKDKKPLKGRKSDGKFKKGVSGNLKGRPKKISADDGRKVSEVWIKEFNEWADSIPQDSKEWKFQKLYVNLIRELADPKEILKVMDKLAPYMIIKKQNEDNSFKKVQFELVMPEEYKELEKKYAEEAEGIAPTSNTTNNNEEDYE